MKVIIHGYGNMGKVVHKLAVNQGHEVFIIDQDMTLAQLKDFDYDVLIDFSNFLAIDNLIEALSQNPKPCIIATTKLSTSQLEKIKELSQLVPIFQDYNTSYGVFVVNEMVSEMTKKLMDYDVEVIERHHRYKKDAPSGTAVRLINTIKNERDLKEVYDYSNQEEKQENQIGVHSIRSGNIVGDHEVIFGSDYDLITIKHEALSKDLFAKGALDIANIIGGMPNGLYNLEDIFKEKK